MRINSLLHKKTDKDMELYRVLAIDIEKILMNSSYFDFIV